MDIEKIKSFLTTAGVNLLLGIIILIVGFFLIHWLVKFLRRSKAFTKLDPSLQSFFVNTIKLILAVIVVLWKWQGSATMCWKIRRPGC